ncbi:MAG: RNA pseudouridine synthase, partial [Duncaniella sp.]|nr:RNA pseudouridine synthase [Duncaniella sp.]
MSDDVIESSAGTEGQGEMYEHFRFVADKGQQLLRVDKFLVARLEHSSRNRVQQA